MSSVVEAAWIAAIPGSLGIIGTVVVSYIGYRGSRQATIATINAGHDARVWEKQTSAYEDAVREVLARRSRRDAITGRGDIGNIGSQPREEILKGEEPEIIRIRAALRAYASEQGWAAYQEADESNAAFWVSLSRLVSANSAAESSGQSMRGASESQVSPSGYYHNVLDSMHAAKRKAAEVDDAFFHVVNSELAWPLSWPTR